MSQPSIAAYFHSRKRAAADELFNGKNKVFVLDDHNPKCDVVASGASLIKNNKIYDGESTSGASNVDNKNIVLLPAQTQENATSSASSAAAPTKVTAAKRVGRRPSSNATNSTTKLKRCLKRATESAQAETGGFQPKIVKFTLAGTLSPRKRSNATNLETTPSSVAAALFDDKISLTDVERGMKTPTKDELTARARTEKLNAVCHNLSMDEIKSTLTKSARLPELKASMDRFQSLAKIAESNRAKAMKSDKHSFSDQQTDRAVRILGKTLQKFDTIELEVLSSPKKGFCTPTKSASPKIVDGQIADASNSPHNELMSPKKAATPRRLFSPTKSSPSKTSMPAYQRFQSLAEAGRPTLQLPYKYRCLAETFKCLDTVCAMFFNRHETITMKKLKPAVQRLLRKNFTESHLAQIHYLYPEAFKFHQKKMLNAGSHTKYDYYQLVITPNVKREPNATITNAASISEDDAILSRQEHSMNPQVIIQRQQRFNNLLLDIVKKEHDKFLRALQPPMIIPPEKITKWHAEFELQSCPDVEKTVLPQPPNIEKFSSAKEILSTARNLFNCATPMERVMQRYEATLPKTLSERLTKKPPPPVVSDTESEPPTPTHPSYVGGMDAVSSMLKGVPKALLERIRAKQAAKALDAMTRRPSQDKEVGKYERLPELARYLRNIFVTESKSVLELDIVMAKLDNSYRERLSRDMLKELLQLIGKEAPKQWLTFHHARKTDFVKIKKDVDLNEIIEVLVQKAADKAR